MTFFNDRKSGAPPSNGGVSFSLPLRGMERQNLGDMLLAANLIEEVQMQIALAEQRLATRRAPLADQDRTQARSLHQGTSSR